MAKDEFWAAKRVPREVVVVGVNVISPGPHTGDGLCPEVIQASFATVSGSFSSQDELLSDGTSRLASKAVDEPSPGIVVDTARSPRYRPVKALNFIPVLGCDREVSQTLCRKFSIVLGSQVWHLDFPA